MSTHLEILYQIVFATYKHEHTLTKDKRPELYKYIWGILKNKKCHLYRINGIDDHIHIITDLHPQTNLADLVKDIKVSSSKFIKENKLFANFKGWQKGYGAFTYASKSKDYLIEYVKNQEEHHKKITFKEEYISLLKEHGVKFDERYLFE